MLLAANVLAMKSSCIYQHKTSERLLNADTIYLNRKPRELLNAGLKQSNHFYLSSISENNSKKFASNISLMIKDQLLAETTWLPMKVHIIIHNSDDC